jgi:hypothetical protein
MSPLLRSLVDADNQRPGPSSDDRTRVYATLGVSLGLIPAGAVVAAHAATAAQVTAVAASGSTSTVATAVGAASAVGRLALLIKAPLMTVGVGAVLGAALTAYVVKNPTARMTATAARKALAAGVLATPRTSPVAPMPLPLPLAEATAPEERPAAPAEHPVAVRTTPVHHDHLHLAAASEAPPLAAAQTDAADVGRAGGALAAEQALLDPARAELARGDGSGALARLELHERRFPGGALAQEREAMTIRALVLTGDRDRARARASTFRADYPDSLLWPMIKATLDATLSARP